MTSFAADCSLRGFLRSTSSFHVVDVVSIGFSAFIQYAQRFFRPIQDFSEKYNILQSAMAASERVFKLLDTPAEITSPAVTKNRRGPGGLSSTMFGLRIGLFPPRAGDSAKTAGNGHLGRVPTRPSDELGVSYRPSPTGFFAMCLSPSNRARR